VSCLSVGVARQPSGCSDHTRREINPQCVCILNFVWKFMGTMQTSFVVRIPLEPARGLVSRNQSHGNDPLNRSLDV
jgi:hypothetical protein